METLIKKITPHKDITWWVKWFSTAFILVGIISRSGGGPQLVDFITTIIGGIGWAWVGYVWNDRSILLLNGGITCILIAGLWRILQ